MKRKGLMNLRRQLAAWQRVIPDTLFQTTLGRNQLIIKIKPDLIQKREEADWMECAETKMEKQK